MLRNRVCTIGGDKGDTGERLQDEHHIGIAYSGGFLGISVSSVHQTE